MKAKVKHDYSIFTKDELASFIKKHENNFRYIESPFDIMIDGKMDDIMKKIDKNLDGAKKLRGEYEQTNDGLKYMIESKKNHEKWQRLDKEYDRLSKLRFGD